MKKQKKKTNKEEKKHLIAFGKMILIWGIAAFGYWIISSGCKTILSQIPNSDNTMVIFLLNSIPIMIFIIAWVIGLITFLEDIDILAQGKFYGKPNKKYK